MTRYDVSGDSSDHDDPIFFDSDLERKFGNRKVFFRLQEKRKKARKFFEFSQQNLFRYDAYASKIVESDSPYRNFLRMIFDSEEEGITFYLAKICWFHHVLSCMDTGLDPKLIRSDMVRFIEYNRDPEKIDYIKDSFLTRLREEEGVHILDECREWLSEADRYKDYNINICFPWLVDNGDWKYCLEKPKCFDYSLIRERCFEEFQKHQISSSIPITMRTRLYKNSVTAKDGITFHRYSKFKEIKEENSHLFSSDRVPYIQYTRVLTYVSPGNIRDTFVPDQSSLVILNEIEALAENVVSQIPGIRIGKRWSNPPYSDLYCMVDTKKFGLTFPHELLHNTLSVLEEYLGLNLSFYHECIDHQYVCVDNCWHKMNRGFGLGNLNKLATLSHYLMLLSAGIKCYVYSDDVLLFLRESNKEQLEILIAYYEACGFVVNKKKCYISPYWEFLGDSSSDVADTHVQQQEFAKFCNILFNDPATIHSLMGQALTTKALLDRTVKRKLFFITYSIVPLVDTIKILLPTQSGGFRWVHNYGNWVENNRSYPVFKYLPPRPSKKIMETEEEKYSVLESLYSRIPIDVKHVRRGRGLGLRELKSYPYAHISDRKLFEILLKEGHFPTFLLRRQNRLTWKQASFYSEIELDTGDPTLAPLFESFRFERVFKGEESVIRLFSCWTLFPRMILGEYHRRYRCTFSTTEPGTSVPSFEKEVYKYLISEEYRILTDEETKKHFFSLPEGNYTPPDETSLPRGYLEDHLDQTDLNDEELIDETCVCDGTWNSPEEEELFEEEEEVLPPLEEEDDFEIDL